MRKVYHVTHRECSEEFIFERRLFNVYVVGLPRSGTSMMTNLVRLLGVSIVETSENLREQRDERYKEQFGEYHPNPNGFYEITRSLPGSFLSLFERSYSGCKLIIPVTGLLFQLLKDTPSKIIMMKREPEAIKASQEAFYSKYSDKAYIRSALVAQQEWLEKAEIDHMVVEYEKVLSKPVEEVLRVAKFINAPKECQVAIDSINPEMRRFV